METQQILDVRIIEPRLKHTTIFNTFDNLIPGENFTIINDHDPKPLYYQFLIERPEAFTWTYLEEGPFEWKVTITKNEVSSPTIGELVAKDYRKALVFKKFGLDFCCGGKKTIEEAATEKGVNTAEVLNALEELDNTQELTGTDFQSWNSAELIQFIENKHHAYVKERLDQMYPLLKKVVAVHSTEHPELREVFERFHEIASEMTSHMEKEEKIVFPYILQLELAYNNNLTIDKKENSMFDTLEDEHEFVGKHFSAINSLTNNYYIPDNACGSYRLILSLLNEFEENLHHHVHLENNILFPRAQKIKQEYMK